jgi:hypothetical protein
MEVARAGRERRARGRERGREGGRERDGELRERILGTRAEREK